MYTTSLAIAILCLLGSAIFCIVECFKPEKKATEGIAQTLMALLLAVAVVFLCELVFVVNRC
jgi:hypothetical protein